MRVDRIMMTLLAAASPAAVASAAPAPALDCAGPVAACTRATPGALALLAPGRPTVITVDAG